MAGARREVLVVSGIRDAAAHSPSSAGGSSVTMPATPQPYSSAARARSLTVQVIGTQPPAAIAATSAAVVSDCWSAITATAPRSEEHTSELQSLMRISYAVFCLKKK